MAMTVVVYKQPGKVILQPVLESAEQPELRVNAVVDLLPGEFYEGIPYSRFEGMAGGPVDIAPLAAEYKKNKNS